MTIENVIYVLVIDGRYWQILEDGSLLEIESGNIPDNSIIADSLNAPQVQQFIAQSPDSLSESFISLATFFSNKQNIDIEQLPSPSAGSDSQQSAYNVDTPLVPPSNINTANFLSTVQRDGLEQLPSSGFDSRQYFDAITQQPSLLNDLNTSEPLPLNPAAEIMVFINDHDDDYINRFEVPVVDIFGQTQKLFDGQFIEVKVTDSKGESIIFATTVSQNQFSLKALDLSSLDQGKLNVTATASDFYGTSVTATDASVIDTLATINNDFVFNGGTLLNALEVQSVSVNGSTSEINPGQTITLVFTDNAGESLSASTTLASDGSYQLSNINLSTLADGDIIVTASSIDTPGNIAEQQTLIVKDTQAAIELQFDGAPPYSATEISTVSLSGTTQNIEAGHAVTVTVTDGSNTETLSAVVQDDGSWQTITLDLSHYDDGLLSATASVSDAAENPTTDTTSTQIDTTVTIDIDTDPNGLDIDELRAGNTVTIKGTTDAEPGQFVHIMFSDTSGNEQTFSAEVQANGSWLSDINITALSSDDAWSLTTGVEDIAGNMSSDSSPSFDIPTSVTLSEDALVASPAGYSQNSIIRITGYDDIRFNDDQSTLSNLTSLGETLSLSINAGQELTLVRPSDNQQVLGAIINNDGTITITLYAAVDQAPLSDSVSSLMSIEATQNDIDGTSETVVASIPLEIRDSGEFTVDDSYTGKELELITGNVFANDNNLEGPLSIFEVNVEGIAHSVTQSTPSIVTTDKGVLTINSNGSWSLLAVGNLDNSKTQTLDFSYTAIDQDKDVDNANVTVTINDGTAGVFPNEQQQTTESNYDDSSTSSIPFTVYKGSDDLLPETLTFSANQGGTLNDLNFTSSGHSITYTFSLDGKSLTASANSHSVFEISLAAVNDGSGNLNGTAILTQHLPLDHLISGSLSFPLKAEAQDIDGTVVTSNSSLLIDDGLNPSSVAEEGTVNEDGLDTQAQTIGNIQIDIGSDQITNIAFISDNQPSITSGGESINYQVSADGLMLTAYTSNPNDPVFTVVISAEPNPTTDSTLGYTFTLNKALDQLDAAKNSLNPLNLDLRYKLSDFDGDVSYASIPIAVSDATPATGTGVTLQLTESPENDSHASTPSSASVDFSLTASKDDITAASFNLTEGMALIDSNGVAVTQNNQALTWHQVNAYTWLARTPANETVIKLELPETIDISSGNSGSVPLTVSVLAALDHLTTDNTLLPLTINFIDSDGTATSLQADISIYDGQNPEAITADDMTVDEHNTLSGSATDTGTATAIIGSDDLKEVQLTLKTPLTSNKLGVSLATSATSDDWWIAKDTNGDEVFRVKIELNGETEFELSAPLDHAFGNTENNLAINFEALVVDADNDESNAIAFTINVTDDVPVDADANLALTEGSTKTINVLSDDQGGADGAVLTNVNYNGTNHIVPSVPTQTLVFNLLDGLDIYGTATISSDGVMVINTAETLNGSFIDSFDFTVKDADEDIEINTLNLAIQDEEANIDIGPLATTEDAPLTLILTADPGDIDDNEVLTVINFDLASLQGGMLTLDGTPLLTDAAGNPVLSAANGTLQVLDPLTQQVGPNGTLVFTPFLNSSDPTSDVSLNVTLTIDADSGTRTFTDRFDVSVSPVTDDPAWDANSRFTYTTDEDGTAPSLSIKANLYDTDGSETLTYRIENIAAGLTLAVNGDIVNNGDILSSSEIANLSMSVRSNLAGQLKFDAVAIATETSTGDSAEIMQTIIIDVTPAADLPTLSTSNVFMLEDQLVDLKSFISGTLNDLDGSETLNYELTLPSGWVVSDVLGVETGLVSPGIYRVSDVDVQNSLVYLKPNEDISSVSENVSLTVAAVAIESSVDGIAPSVPEALSPPRTVELKVKGVVDNPTIGTGPDNAWSFDGSNISGTFNEDTPIALNFATGTEDDDASEVYSFVISDLPDGVKLVNENGSDAELPVIDEFNGKPVYSVSATELASLFILPVTDYSGQLSFGLKQVNTEPDGDSDKFNLVVDITINPVVDTANSISTTSVGAEDTGIMLDLSPDLADIDGSETLTNVILQTPPNGAVILLDDTPVTFSGGTLDIAQLATDNGTDFNILINSGRLTVLPPEDSDANFTISVTFEITDTSVLGDTAINTVNGTLDIDVKATVDDSSSDGFTHINTSSSTLISSDGSAIDLSTAASFNEADIDGSEYLDYITISIPQSDGWFVTHPNGAIHDGQGNWLIPATGLTSDSVVETTQALLAGATIVSDHITTPPAEIIISARVLDHNDDADIIQSTITVDFQVAGNTGSAQAIDILQTSIIGGFEAQIADTNGHINTAADGDSNDAVSFRVDVSDMAYGGALTGTDVITQYASDGSTVIAYVFTNASLDSLRIVGINEDFAGATSIVVNKVSTDPLGDTVVTTESLAIELEPIVDSVDTPATIQVLEDIPQYLNIDLNSLLNDSSTQATEGEESVLSVKFLALSEGSLSDPNGLLVDNGDSTFTLNDPSRINEILYVPPGNKHGSSSLNIELTVQDQTTGITLSGLNNTVTQVVTTTLNFNIIAVTDSTVELTSRQYGDEDSDIALSGLTVIDLDNDGSETLSLQLLGMPLGAILFYDNGSTLEQLNNNGPEGINGFTWSFTPDQLNNLVLRPPRDFAGDIELTLQSTSMETSTQVVVTNFADFVLEVNPVADNAAFTHTIENITTKEGDIIEVAINAETLEAINPNETITVTVFISATGSDSSAIQGLESIKTPDGKTAIFSSTALGFTATINTILSELPSLEILVGEHAFGTLDVTIFVGSTDTATVGGIFETDTSSLGDMVSQSLSIEIMPIPSEPELTLSANNILAGDSLIPLGLNISQLNPAPGETSDIVINGLPPTLTLSAGSQSGAQWIVNQADIDTLSIENGLAGETYTLSIEPRSTLNDETVSGSQQLMTVEVQTNGNNTLIGNDGQNDLLLGGDGDDTLTGGTGQDTFLFRVSDMGSVGTPTNDTVNDFTLFENDQIDLTDIIAGLTTGAALDTVIGLTENNGTTTLEIDLGGASPVQNIALSGVSKDDLYGASSIGVSDADILQQMINDQILVVGS